MLIRRVDCDEAEVIEVIANRMRMTLVEVLGEAIGATMFSHEQLVDRVHFHLDPERCTGAVFVADAERRLLGHTIVRIGQERGEEGAGVFATTYVAADARHQGVARQLLEQGERWMQSHDLERALTYTDAGNQPLIALYEGQGYTVTQMFPERGMIELSRALNRPD